MATIQLTDQLGLLIDISPNPFSIFTKYVKGLAEAKGRIEGGKDISRDTVASYPFKSQSIGIGFDQSIPLGTAGVELDIKPKVSGSVSVSTGSDVLDTTLFDKPDARPLMDQTYLSAALEASFEPGLANTPGNLQFGFDKGTDVVITYAEPVNPSDKLLDALNRALKSAILPGDLEDIQAMDPGSIASVQGTGTLTFTGALNVLTVTNPLASVATGIPLLGSINLTEGGSIGLNASLSFTGDYELQVCKLDAKRVLLSWSRTRGRELDVTFTGEIGLSGGLGKFDLIKTLLETASSDPVPPQEDLEKAGVTDDEIGAISDAIKAGIERSLQLAFTAELDLSDQHTRAFLYEIDLSALADDGKLAVRKALDGNLSGLEGGNLAGVKPLRSVISAVRERTRKLNLNLLGVLNAGSVSDLLQKSTFIVDPDTGDITIMDKTAASQVGLVLNNFAKNGNKVRRIVGDGFLATCIYRASQTGFRPNVASKCWAFAFDQSADFDRIQDFVNIAVSLNLIGRGDADKKLAELKNVRRFGRAVLYAESSYDDALFKSLFFDDAGQIRPREYYERVGREAMAATLAPDSPVNRARLLPLIDDNLWARMSAGGQTTFPRLFSDDRPEEIADITGDYSIIKWWASAMSSLGEALSNLLAFLGSSGVKDANNNTFIALRGELDKRLAAAAQQTHDRFTEPWGLVAMSMAAGQKSPTSLLITSRLLSLSLSRGRTAPLTAKAGR